MAIINVMETSNAVQINMAIRECIKTLSNNNNNNNSLKIKIKRKTNSLDNHKNLNHNQNHKNPKCHHNVEKKSSPDLES